MDACFGLVAILDPLSPQAPSPRLGQVLLLLLCLELGTDIQEAAYCPSCNCVAIAQ